MSRRPLLERDIVLAPPIGTVVVTKKTKTIEAVCLNYSFVSLIPDARHDRTDEFNMASTLLKINTNFLTANFQKRRGHTK